MNIDEVDFFDQGSDSPAFMHLRGSDGNGISIEFAIIDNPGLKLPVSVEDACRLGERLVAAAKDIAAGL